MSEPAMAEDPVDFDQLSALLRDFGALQSAAELHGLLVGYLAAGRRPSRSEWLRIANEQADLSRNPDEVAGDLLQALYQQTLTTLLGSELEFQLLLPDDDATLLERVNSLGQWAQGFLLGYGLAGNTTTDDAELVESLRDLAAIAQIAADDENETEDSSESDLFAICEYVRLTATDIFWRNEEGTAAPINPTEPPPSPAPASPTGSSPSTGGPANLFRRNKLH